MLARSRIQLQAHRRALVAVMVSALAGCPSFDVQPHDDSVVTLSSPTDPTHVVVIGSPSMTGVNVQIDSSDVTSQMAYKVPTPSDGDHSEGDIHLSTGMHTVVGSADVSCWYCTGNQYHPTAVNKFCVAIPVISMTQTTFSQSDNMSWASVSAANGTLASDTGMSTTRWLLRLLGGAVSDHGMIESVVFPCRCLRSPDDNQNSQITLALCDSNDIRQRWRALRWQQSSSKGIYSFFNSSNDLALTEGSGNQLVQADFHVAQNQLWTVRNNSTNVFDTATTPWL